MLKTCRDCVRGEVGPNDNLDARAKNNIMVGSCGFHMHYKVTQLSKPL